MWTIPDASEALQPCPLATCCPLSPAGLTQTQTDILGWVGCPGLHPTQSLWVPTSKALGPTMEPCAHHQRPLSLSSPSSSAAVALSGPPKPGSNVPSSMKPSLISTGSSARPSSDQRQG